MVLAVAVPNTLKHFQLNRKLNKIYHLLAIVWPQLMGYIFCFAALLGMLVLQGHFVFGVETREFSTYKDTSIETLMVSKGKPSVDYTLLQAVDRFLAPLYRWGVVILVYWCFFTIFIAIYSFGFGLANSFDSGREQSYWKDFLQAPVKKFTQRGEREELPQ